MARKSNAVKAAEAAAKAAEEAKAAESEPKAESIKVEEKKEEKKAAAKKEPVKKDAAKTTASKTTAKTTTAKKAETECSLQIQFGGKSYGQEELMKIAKDVWKYDLKQKARDLVSVELYVKPEENKVYYVMNGEYTGNFAI